MFNEPVIEISTREVTTITPETSVAKAIGIMEKNNFHNLVVLAGDGDSSGRGSNSGRRSGGSSSGGRSGRKGGVGGGRGGRGGACSEIYHVCMQDLLVVSNPESSVEGVMFKPHCVYKDTTTLDAICELVDSGQRAAPVTAGDGKLVGIVSEYDFMKRGAESVILSEVKAAEIMSRDLVCVEETESIGRARSIMRKNNIGRLLVVDADGKLRGIVTSGDILKIYKPMRKTTVGEVKGENIPIMEQPVSLVMSSPVTTASPDASLAEVASLLQEHDIRGVPIVSGEVSEGREEGEGVGVPRGVVTILDIMKYLRDLKEKAKINIEIQGSLDEEHKELADKIIETEVRKIVRIAKRVHWIKIVLKKERDKGGISYYKISAHVKTPDKLYVAQSEPGGTGSGGGSHSHTQAVAEGEEEMNEQKAGKRRWDFVGVLKDALLSVERQIEEDRERGRKRVKRVEGPF
ncbi:MAG: CBS domain-containing protein [Candidatus Methanophagaceae archaeon]|nr:MAG: CBS domain-containing protein [Methanophagales archaeon]